MKPSDFSERRSGRLIKHQRGYWSFIPNPLPPHIELSWKFERPYITFSQARKALKVTFRSAQLNVRKLVTAKILHELPGRKYGRIFVAREIVNILEAREPK